MKIQGIGIGGLLFLIFLTPKLTGIGAVLAGIILLIVGLVVLASKL